MRWAPCQCLSRRAFVFGSAAVAGGVAFGSYGRAAGDARFSRRGEPAGGGSRPGLGRLQSLGRDQPGQDHAHCPACRHRAGRWFDPAGDDRGGTGPGTRPVRGPLRRAQPRLFQHRLRARTRALHGGGPEPRGREGARGCAGMAAAVRPADDRRLQRDPRHLSRSCAWPAPLRGKR